MPRILAIDYGRKRTGIAATDDLQLIASGVTTVPTQEVLPWLKKYFGIHNVSEVVVGDPVDLRGRPAEIAPQVHEFIRAFKKRYPQIELVTYDERFTSKMAVQTMIESGLKKKARQNKGLVDEISATILLQSYLEHKNRMA